MDELPPSSPESPTRVLDCLPENQLEERFGIHPWGWGVFVAAMACYVLFRFPQDSADGIERWIPLTLGAVCGTLIFGMLLAMAAFYFGKRSRKAASVVFSLVAGIAAFGQIQSVLDRRPTASGDPAVSQWTAQMREAQDRMFREMESEEGFDPSKAHANLEAAIDATDKASALASGAERTVLLALSETFRRIERESSRYARSVEELAEKPPLLPGWIKRREDIAKARSAIARFRRSSNAARSFPTRMPIILQEELARQNVPARSRAELTRVWTVKFEKAKPSLATIRDTEEAMGRELLQACDLLDADWGKWSYDAEQKVVLFDNPDSSKRFDDIVERVNRINEQQSQAQKDYVKALR